MPVIIRELTDSETMQLALIENLQREDLSPLEEAAGYKSLMDEYGFSQEDVARIVGRSRSAVANSVRLLGLPEEVRELVDQGRLSSGHARALLAIEDKTKIVPTAEKVAESGMSVRETESAVKRLNSSKPKKKSPPAKAPTVFREIELSMAEELGTKVRVTPGAKAGQGTLSIEFYSPDELFRLASRLMQPGKEAAEE